jgi:DNA topoisomerase-1
MAEKKERKTRLVVVESPAKARTIGQYLGAGYRVRATVGHIRDLPEGELGVDVEDGFTPRYVTIRGKGKVIQELRREAESADEVILATDPDREGEAIAYHVVDQLGYADGLNAGRQKAGGKSTAGNDGKPGVPVLRRVLFHEITKDAIGRALKESVALDLRKFEAQQARRILDRLVGYQASPLLWKPIRPGLSAGRVQTVALRLITEREDEIRAFITEEYWSITARLEKEGQEFEAKLHQIDGEAFRLENEAAAQAVLDEVEGTPFVASEVKRRERIKSPPAPFTTSTLQQEAAKRLGFTAQKTMRVAQQLYEGVDLGAEGSVGLITYMRTDSTRVAPVAAQGAREWIEKQIGERYIAPGGPRLWGSKKQKGAQEAHEAIRPTEAARHPDAVKRHLDRDQFRLYELVWLRFVAGQMAPAVFDTMTINFDLAGRSGRRYLFRATGSVMKFDGFTRLYREAREEGDKRTLDDEAPLPNVDEGESCNLLGLDPAQHFTQPPPRYSEASLVKQLESEGIGRPSTYAQIISTLKDRKYVELREKRFHPTPLGETVAKFLVRLFPEFFDVGFTSGMEAQLDQIEEGELDWRRVLEDFHGPFTERLNEGKARSEEVMREVVGAEDEECPDCGQPLALKWSRHGRFFGCSGYPECKYTKPLDEKERKEPQPIGKPCPKCESELVEREGRLGTFIACSGYPKCKYTEPVTVPGLKCPECGEGDIAEKRSRRGKVFWSCTRYPDCTWSSWDRPVAGPCPDCTHAFLVAKSTKAKGDFLRCPGCKGEFVPENVAG